MANSDLFAAPSPEELASAQKANAALFAPPSDEEIAAAKESQDKPAPGIGAKILSLISAGSKAFDSVTGAPTRAGIFAAQNSESPGDIVSDFGKGFSGQFAKNPALAASGEDIVKKAGVPEGIPSKVAGFGMDMAANPLNFTGPVLAGAGKAVDAAESLPYVGDTIGAAAGAPGRLATWLASKVTKTPKQALKIYADDPGAVNDFMANTGGELSSGADAMKEKVLGNIKATKKGLNDEITQSLANNPARVQVQPILDKLAAAKSKLNPHYNASDIQQIDEMMNAITNTAKDGQMGLQDLYDTKNFLSTRAQGSFLKEGQLFTSGQKASQAANDARKLAADTLHGASPEIAHSDAIYSQLHDIDDKMSAALLGTGKSENVFASAGGASPGQYGNQHYTALKELGEITGTNPLKDAQIVYAAKQLNQHPSLAKEGYKTLITGAEALRNSSIPGKLSPLLEGIASPTASPVLEPLFTGRKSTAIERRMSSTKR